MSNDKILENINSQIEGLTSAVKNQLSFNKMIETQLAQIATTISIDSNGKLATQPKNSHENVKAVTMRGGKTTHDPPNPNQSIGKVEERLGGQTFDKRKRTRRGDDTKGLC